MLLSLETRLRYFSGKLAPGATRTHDHSVKSRVLYQLSYGRSRQQGAILTVSWQGRQEQTLRIKLL